MRALVTRGFGGTETLDVAEIPVPEAGPGQLRLKVAAAAVNPVDVATRAGMLAAGGLMGFRDVVGLGWDVAGTVDQVGAGVSGFTVGDEVIGLSDLLELPAKTQAEYVVLDADTVALSPRGVPATRAATLPLNGLTAAQALDLLDLRPGQTLLVTGAAGGVGGFAVQLAASQGLHVVAVAGERDESLVRGFGARWFVPRGADLAPAVRALVPGGVDGALDAAVVGNHARDAVRGAGAFVAVVGGAAPVPLRGIRVENVWIRADGRRLAELAALVEKGELTLPSVETYPLEQAAAAQDRLAAGGLRGRLVLVP
ncbi:NADP-dependent oxidoreductase [Sphaerisporangium fuscum]|uniref:NADP-dependent oxidoreductase n=1 Tax=Sphaerisporangium fuscum TaxID=2835868 RepID=UPI001BDBE430|nr:NADP-dependent oxidoreductase [Sphaerisporangium fuscum]